MKRRRVAGKRRNSGSESDSDDDNDGVQLINNSHIVFLGEVNNKTFGQFRRILLTYKNNSPLVIHIFSHGGDATLGLALYDIIQAVPYHTVSIIEGTANSAATLIALACNERYMTQHSTIMIHQLWCNLAGNVSDQRVELQNTNRMMERYVSIYKKETNLSKMRINKELLTDQEMNLDEAIEHGFVIGLPDAKYNEPQKGIRRPVHANIQPPLSKIKRENI